MADLRELIRVEFNCEELQAATALKTALFIRVFKWDERNASGLGFPLSSLPAKHL